MTILRASIARRLRYFASVTFIVLLLLSTTGVIGWFLSHIPPDPTRVSNLQDNDRPGSLRYAVEEALPKSTIRFDVGLRGTILLTSGDLNIAKDLTIQGPGAGMLSISSGKRSHIVNVLSGVTVTIFGLTFKGSNTSTSFIANAGTLILSNSTVSGNTTQGYGGGIFNYPSSTVTLNNSTVSGNTATSGDGGGIGNLGDTSSTVTLNNSTVSGNTATGNGGGIGNDGTVTLNNSTVSGNTATSGDGGGIYNIQRTLTVSNSTASGNTATSGDGGGIFIQSADVIGAFAHVDLTFMTMYGNTAHGGSDIAIEDVPLSIINGNSQAIKQRSQVKIRNSIVAGNPAHPGLDFGGMLTSYGYNLFQDTSGATFDPVTSTQHSTDKMLSVSDLSRLFASPVGLRYNGGPTKTLALDPDSPAVDQIPLAACHINGITTDQRSTKRPDIKRPDVNVNKCDIGAYEYVDAPS